MDAIGGYFDLELRRGKHFHENALRLNTARNCFEYVLRARKYSKVYMPYYTCEVMFQPLEKLSVQYECYHIDFNFELTELPILKSDEAILYTNYFALKQKYIQQLVRHYGNRLIIDNAQAFYAKPVEGIDTFYSARKFFGVPDGAYLYTECILDEDFEQDISIDRMLHLLKRIEFSAEAGYQDFRMADNSLDNQPIRWMSKLTEALLCNIDYVTVAERRIRNFKFIHEFLKNKNSISDLWLGDNDVPLCYPYRTENKYTRGVLLKNKIYTPIYWQNVIDDYNCLNNEALVSKEIIPIPVDQRYTEINLENILKYECSRQNY